jgi:parallel beta-helix repeat protein
VRQGLYRESLRIDHGGTSWNAPIRLVAYPGEMVTIRGVPDGPTGGVIGFTAVGYVSLEGLIIDGTDVALATVKIFCDKADFKTCGHHIRIKDCEVRNSPITCLTIWGNNHELSNLTIHDCGTRDPAMSGAGVSISGQNNTVIGSRIFNTSSGLHVYASLTDGNDDNLVVGNVFHQIGTQGAEKRGPAIYLSNGARNRAYNNVIYESHHGVYVRYGAKDTLVAHNTIYGNAGRGIQIDAAERGAENTTLLNNVLLDNKGGAFSTNEPTTVVANNLTQGDPPFVDASAHDFHLKPGTAAVDKGVSLAEVSHDFDGVKRPQGAAPDLGAFELLVP